MENLKPCPFCGEKPKTKVVISALNDEMYFRIYCPQCENVGKNSGRHKTGCMIPRLEDDIDAVAEAWNRRANDEQADC